MDFLRNLFGKKQPTATSSNSESKGSEQSVPTKGNAKNGVSISLWAKDEATANRLATDQFFLMGVLMGDSSSATKNFLAALNKGGTLSHKVFRNSAKGGYNVEITVTPEA